MSPIELTVGVIQAGIALALLFLLPGLSWGRLIAPGATTPLLVLGRSIGVSLLMASMWCTFLAWVGLLRPSVVAITLAGLTLAPLAHPSGRAAAGRGLRRVQRIVASVRSGRRTRIVRWLAGALGGAVVAVALIVVPSRLAVGEALLPFTSTVWYYANLARDVAARGGLPASLPEWGAQRPFQTDYLPFTAHSAAALQLLPGDLLVQLELYRLAVLVAAIGMATLLLRRWVSSWIALLGACLLLASVRLNFKFIAYKPETFAFVLALFTLWAADRALAERSRRLAGLAVVSGTVVFLAHAEVFLLLGPALLGLALGRGLVVARPAAGVQRWVGISARPLARPMASLAVAGSILGGALLLGIGGGLLLTGEARVLGYLRPDRATGAPPPTAAQANRMPAGWTLTDDPTWDFYVAAVAPGQLGRQPPADFFDRRLLQRSILWVWPGLDARAPSLLLVLAAVTAAPVLLWPALDRRRRRAVVTWLIFGAGLLAGSYLLFALSGSYVPQRTGPRRLMPYELLLPVVAICLLWWALDRLLRPGWRALLPGRGAMAAAGAALLVLTIGAVSPAPEAEAEDEPEPGLTAVGFEAYRWIAANLPPDARILANAYTDGSLTALGERVGIVDGRAVYLEDRELLREATRLLLGARLVFGSPDEVGAGNYLQSERVSHLLIGGPAASGSDLGGYPLFETDLDAIRRSDRYTLVRTFGEDRLLLFAVRPSDGGAAVTCR